VLSSVLLRLFLMMPIEAFSLLSPSASMNQQSAGVFPSAPFDKVLAFSASSPTSSSEAIIALSA
jgi:hypothetical protein